MPRRAMLEAQAEPCKCAPCGVTRVLMSPMIVVVVSLVAMSYFPLVVWRGPPQSALAVVHLVWYHAVLALLLGSYFMTVFTDPGTPPAGWQERQRRNGNPEQLRQCHRSMLLKPPRSHYCSVTRRLVLNMDHFCPWVDNTVGYYNRKFFMLFLVYSCIACLYSAVMLYLDGAFSTLRPRRDSPATLGGATVALMAAVVDASLGAALVFFAGFHLLMAARNETTIEGCGFADPRYDLGWEANLEQVFGRNRWLWWLPVYGDGPVGDGVHWPTASVELMGDGARLTEGSSADAMSDESV